jgi:hypothetical protein
VRRGCALVLVAQLGACGRIGFAAAPDALPDAHLDVVLFSDDFETCDYGTRYVDRAQNAISMTVAHGGMCSSIIDIDVAGYGKLIVDLGAGSGEVWIRGWVSFAPSLVLPTTNAGIDMWIATADLDGTGQFGGLAVPSGGPGLQVLSGPGDTNGAPLVQGSSISPADGAGGWHCIELHERLNTPGASDGLIEGWLDGATFASVPGSLRGSSAATVRYVDVQAELDGSWPAGTYWALDDLEIATFDPGC